MQEIMRWMHPPPQGRVQTGGMIFSTDGVTVTAFRSLPFFRSLREVYYKNSERNLLQSFPRQILSHASERYNIYVILSGSSTTPVAGLP